MVTGPAAEPLGRVQVAVVTGFVVAVNVTAVCVVSPVTAPVRVNV